VTQTQTQTQTQNAWLMEAATVARQVFLIITLLGVFTKLVVAILSAEYLRTTSLIYYYRLDYVR
jgi:hypothetical protein